ncbi:MAG: hypothetical protein OWQ51_12560 [Pyrobaculum arsenaticum]|uniref:Uncharacterized protein n=1 Tax=Pyrobaculum arsenaticum TaxID=121277 RepID=A0A7L4PBX7_9CREN|nr:hypothetical protein [Pyrobaculum arsenaticum]MCY0891773.1 hypothetical protein [Pyrobaculum arsenaticum]NYR16438.1 hypothetical protein [Pyrobaculum arsenaticum]
MENEIRKYKTYVTVIKVGILGIIGLALLASATILPTNTPSVGVGIF